MTMPMILLATVRYESRYEEAHEKYQESKAKFQRGFDMSNEERFKECIQLVQEHIINVREILKNVFGIC
jgi:hypothetical protein